MSNGVERAFSTPVHNRHYGHSPELTAKRLSLKVALPNAWANIKDSH